MRTMRKKAPSRPVLARRAECCFMQHEMPPLEIRSADNEKVGTLLISFALEKEHIDKKQIDGAMRKTYLDGQPFRIRADECRTKAELSYDVRARERMLKLAANYELIANTADELMGTEPSGGGWA